MRLAIITLMGGAPWGGSEDLWADAALASRERGDSVLALRFAHPHEPEPIRILRSRGVQVRSRAFRHGKIQRQLDRWHDPFSPVRAFQPDAIILSQGGAFDLLNDPSADRLRSLLSLGVPYLIVCHGNDEQTIPIGPARAIALRLFQGARSVCFVSERMRALASRQLAADLPRAAIVRNPVRAQDGAGPPPVCDGLRLAMLARLDTNKAVEVLLEALSGPIWHARDWTLAIAGDGPMRPYLAELASYYQIDSRVRFLGHASDVRPILAGANLLALTSRSEGLPISLLEGALASRALLATDVGGVGELVVEGVTGFLAAAPTVRSVGEALERAWQARGSLSPLGEAAHRHAQTFLHPAPGRALLQLLDDAATPPVRLPGRAGGA